MNTAEEFDKFLAKDYQRPEFVFVHPRIWNDHIAIKPIPLFIRKLGRFLGRKFGNKYLYWIGIPVYWEKGLKSVLEDCTDFAHIL